MTEEEYTSKKNDWVSNRLVANYLYLSDDCYCDPLHIIASVAVWENPDTPTLDKLLMLC